MITKLPILPVVSWAGPRGLVQRPVRVPVAQPDLVSPPRVRHGLMSIANGAGHRRSEPPAPAVWTGRTGPRLHPSCTTTWNQVIWMRRDERSAAPSFPNVRNLIGKLAAWPSRVESNPVALTSPPLQTRSLVPTTLQLRSTALPSSAATTRSNTPPPPPPKPEYLGRVLAERAAAAARRSTAAPAPAPAPPTMPKPPTVRATQTHASRVPTRGSDSVGSSDRSALLAEIRNFKPGGGLKTRYNETQVLESQGRRATKTPELEIMPRKIGQRGEPDMLTTELAKVLARRGGPNGNVHEGTGTEPIPNDEPQNQTQATRHGTAAPASPYTPTTPPDGWRGKYGELHTLESDSVVRQLALILRGIPGASQA